MKRTPLKRGSSRLVTRKPLRRTQFVTPLDSRTCGLAARGKALVPTDEKPERVGRQERCVFVPVLPTLKRGKRLRKVGARSKRTAGELVVSRSIVLGRANDRCERCRDSILVVGPLHVHHVRARSQGGTHAVSNLVALCARCHSAVHDHRAPDWRRWIKSAKSSSSP